MNPMTEQSETSLKYLQIQRHLLQQKFLPAETVGPAP